MAGTSSQFDAAAFRDAIRFAMNMGLPTDTTERATFRWDDESDFDVADAADHPFDWTATPTTTTTYPDVQVAVAVEFFSKGGDTQATHIGEFDVARVVLTLLDEEFAEVMQYGRQPDVVEIDGADYLVQYVGPPLGLFEVTVYQIFARARDES